MSPSPERGEGEEFRRRFERLRAEVNLHPAESTAAASFETAAATARLIATDCLPLGIAVVMHLYPLCALRWLPLPWWSAAHWQRTLLLGDIDRRSLILANAGSERASGADAPVTLREADGEIRINGTFEYMSLAHVADLVLFSAVPAGSGSPVFCVADLARSTVHIGASKFDGSMRLSDTCAVTFSDHVVPSSRFVRIPGDGALNCKSQYQRSWFQLLLGESYLARIGFLRNQWNLPLADEQVASFNELARLREYALRLLDEATPRAIDSLSRVTAAMKLRISWHAQSTAAALKGLDDVSAGELGYLRLQPTSDARILESIGAYTDTATRPPFGTRSFTSLSP